MPKIMGKANKEKNLKGIYRLWFNYLKLSDDYRELCEWVRLSKENPYYPLPRKIQKETKEGVHPIWGKKREKRPGWEISPQMLAEGLHPLAWGFAIWGDVHARSFEDWWRLKKLSFLGWNSTPSVEDFKEIAASDIERIMEKLKAISEECPSSEELKNVIFAWLKSPARILITVDLWREKSNSELAKEFYNTIRELRKKTQTVEFLNWRGAWKYPTHPVRIKELNRYLEIHKLRNPKSERKRPTIKQMADMYFPQKEGDKEVSNPERVINEILAKVKKIIENTESGIFPGNY